MLNGRFYETNLMVIDDVLEYVTVGFIINRNKTALISRDIVFVIPCHHGTFVLSVQ